MTTNTFKLKLIVTICLCIFITAFSLRILAVSLYPQTGSDSGKYLQLSKSLRETGSFSFDNTIPDDSRAPVYPFFVATIQRINNNSLHSIRVIQSFVDALTCVIYFFIALLLFKSLICALCVSLLLIIHPGLIGSTSFILSETLSIFLIGLSLLLVVLSFKTYRLIYFALSGVLLGITTLCKPVTLLFPFCLLVILPFCCTKDQHMFRRLVLTCLFLILTIAPWSIRNYIQFQTFIPVSANLGGNLFIASNQNWNGSYDPEMVTIRSNIRKALPSHQIGTFHVDNILKERGIEAIQNDYLGYIRLSFRRIVELWGGIPGGIEVLKEKKRFVLSMLLFHYVILIFAISGFIGLIKRKRFSALIALPILFILYFTGLHSALVALPRYRLPVMPMVLLFSGYGMWLFFFNNWARTSLDE